MNSVRMASVIKKNKSTQEKSKNREIINGIKQLDSDSGNNRVYIYYCLRHGDCFVRNKKKNLPNCSHNNFEYLGFAEKINGSWGIKSNRDLVSFFDDCCDDYCINYLGQELKKPKEKRAQGCGIIINYDL